MMSWASLIPPLLVFLLGFATKKIRSSLFIGVLAAAFIATSAFGLGNLLCVFNRAHPRAFQDIWAECEVVVLGKTENLEQLNR